MLNDIQVILFTVCIFTFGYWFGKLSEDIENLIVTVLKDWTLAIEKRNTENVTSKTNCDRCTGGCSKS